jgi:ABC-type multidrug transport system ATPase subunit
LQLRHLTQRWRGAPAPVLDDLDLDLAPGTCSWIVGRNGVGKTTLLRIAAGLLGAQRGQVRAFGLDPQRDRGAYQRTVALLAAGDRGLYARLTVRAQLEFCGRVALLPQSEFARAVERTIERFGLGLLSANRVDRMSTGQRQRLRLAMTFLPSPRLVLLDEPLASLDADGARMLDAVLEEHCARGGSALWCSPQAQEAARELPQGERWGLRDGRLIAW